MRNYSYPIIIDNLLKIEVSHLKNSEGLEPNQIKTATMKWLSNGKITNSLAMKVDTTCQIPYLRISYRCNEEKITQNIDLISKKSNLGVGTVWYFYCPIAQQLCRKLYFSNGKFTHRSAINGLYVAQTKSKKDRLIDNLRESMYGTEKIYEKIYSKHFKKHYRGKPTKKYKILLNKLERNDRNSDLMFSLLK